MGSFATFPFRILGNMHRSIYSNTFLLCAALAAARRAAHKPHNRATAAADGPRTEPAESGGAKPQQRSCLLAQLTFSSGSLAFSEQLELDVLGAFPLDLLAQVRELLEAGGQGEEVIPRQAPGHARERRRTVWEENLHLRTKETPSCQMTSGRGRRER